MSKKLITTRLLKGEIRRHTLANDITVSDAQYAARLKRHFSVSRKESRHILDCNQIRTIYQDVFAAIIKVHQTLAKRGKRLVISVGDNARQYSQYRCAFASSGVCVCITEEAAILELSHS